MWRQVNLNIKPEKSWKDAAVRWLNESQHKRSLADDKLIIKWLSPYLINKKLSEINSEYIAFIAKEKEATGAAPATINNHLQLIRAILRKAAHEWKWIEKAPLIKMRKTDNERTRWLTRKEVEILLRELPSHLCDMVKFTLATGLRAANVRLLQWDQVDLTRQHAFVPAHQSKSKKALSVPLNENAIAILEMRRGINKRYVFTYRNHPVKKCSTKAWRLALKRAGIDDFKWHDLRHTWASWHVQNGTSLQALQQLGGWASLNMVLRYAYLSSDHLQQAAQRICDTELSQPLNFCLNENV